MKYREIPRGSIWISTSGVKLMVINIAKHADDCTVEFVYFTNVVKSFDSEPGEKWILEKTAFMSRYAMLDANPQGNSNESE